MKKLILIISLLLTASINIYAQKDENQTLEQAKALQKEDKHTEALTILNTGLDNFPTSTRILNEALQIYLALDRTVDALRLLDDRIKAYPEKTQ